MRADYLDEVVWEHLTALLADPARIRGELDRRLAELRAANPQTATKARLEREQTRTATAISRLVEAYQEQLLSLDELRSRMPALRAKQQTVGAQLDALDVQLIDQETTLKLAENLESFLGRLCDKADTASVLERQRVLRLLVKEVLIGPERVVIRHRIPVTSPDPTPGYLLRGRSHHPAAGQRLPAPAGPPLLANVYLHRLDRAWQTREHGVLVRYADDALVVCATAEQAKAALARLTVLLAELGLEPKAAKTRIVHLVEGGEGVDFLGFDHRLVRGRTPKSAHLTFLARWPARKATQHARDRIREITDRARLWVPVQDIVKELNRFLRGWAGYFRYGNSARVLGQIRNYALRRVALLLSKKGKRRRSWAWGMKQVLLSPNHLGLSSLDGAVVAPRPFRDWRGRPNATR